MKMKTSELTGAALDLAVSMALGWRVVDSDKGTKGVLFLLPDGTHSIRSLWKHSTDWAQGGPIIERERIWLKFPLGDVGEVEALHGSFLFPRHLSRFGPTALIAAMRCYVMAKLGDEVEVPDELV